MGSLIGGAIGLAGSLLGGGKKKQAATAAQGLDLTGYNYLTKGDGSNFTKTAAANGATASNDSAGLRSTQAALLGQGGDPAAAKTAFSNYLGSTGYNFQMDQGSRAITGGAASRGLLQSGGTAKALTSFGQNLGSNYFSKYMGQLGDLNGQDQSAVQSGQSAVSAAGAAGSAGGQAAGAAAQNGGNAQGNSIANAAGIAGSAVSNNWGDISNFLGRVF